MLSINLAGHCFLTQLALPCDARPSPRRPRLPWRLRESLERQRRCRRFEPGPELRQQVGVKISTRLRTAALADFAKVAEVRPVVIEIDSTAGEKAKYDLLFASGPTVVHRRGIPDDVARAVARAVALLASGEPRDATREVLTVNGGLTIQGL